MGIVILFLSLFPSLLVGSVTSLADTQGTDFQVVFTRNVELQSTNCNLSITVINPNSDDAKVSFNYYNVIYDYSSMKRESVTLPPGAIYTHFFPSSLAWEHMNGGFQEQFDTRIAVNTTAPVSLYANNYNKEGYGDSYLVLPNTMAGTSYSFTLPVPSSLGNANQYAMAYILPASSDVNVEVTVGDWNEKRLISFKNGSNVNYFAVQYTSKLKDPLFTITGDSDFLVVAAVSCLPFSAVKCDYAAFMPSPLLINGVCNNNHPDWHPTDLITSNKFSVTMGASASACGSTVTFSDGKETIADQLNDQSTIYNLGKAFQDRIIMSTDFLTVPIRIGTLPSTGGSFLTGLVSTTQFVTGMTHFMTRTAKSTAYIVVLIDSKNQMAGDIVIRLDSNIMSINPEIFNDSSNQYLYTKLEVASSSTPTVHTLEVSSGKYIFYVTGSQSSGHAYGYYPAFNKLAASSVPDPQPIEQSDPRYSSYKSYSDLLVSWMNTSVDPCDDFYAFTCGAGKPGQGMSFDISDDAITESMLQVLKQPAAYFGSDPLPVRQMKWFYDSCMIGADQQAFMFRSIGIFNDMRRANPDFSFPALFPAETRASTPQQLASFLGYSIGSGGITTLIDVGVDTDWMDPHNAKGGYALLVDQPATMFTSTFYTNMYQNFKEDVVDELLYTINAAAKLLNIWNVDQIQARKDAQDMAQLDYDLATKYSTDDTTRRQYARSYNPYSADGLQTLAPFLDWKTFFNKALVPISTTVDGSFRSIALEVEKLALLSSDISSGVISPRTINNYLYIRALDSNYLPDPDMIRKTPVHLKQYRRVKRPINRKIRQDPKRVDPMEMVIVKDYTSRESNCLQLTNAFLMWANTRVYVDTNYPSEQDKQTVRDQAGSMVNSIVAAFRAQIDLLDWMTPTSKTGAYQKIDNLVVNIAFPDWVLDDGKLNDYYKKLDTTQNEAYLSQADKLIAFNMYEAFTPLISGAPADRTDFSGPAAITNAWYQPEMNSITFPGGILHEPFYDPNYPAAVNYGGLGVIGGHELTHGFDDEGVQWEGTGILSSWMDDSSTKSFNQMAQCVVDEYNNFCPLGAGLPCVNGEQTQGENIADNGGVQIAYKAFKSYEAVNGPDPLLPGAPSVFNSDQLFFLSFAQVWCQYPPSAFSLLAQILTDPHSPSLYRVLGTLQNVPAFQKAFNCPIGSTYAPASHCDVWSPFSV